MNIIKNLNILLGPYIEPKPDCGSTKNGTMTIKNGSMTIQNDAMKTGITIEEVTVSILFQNTSTLKSNHTNYGVVKCIFI